ncbi:MAG: hypothetical protein M1834_002805 [Cirrosporium novae-zelandiae]|nr:MAG: hypothetical protein M1834_002805 [Cirrosporium novae-zelandiae]
MKGTFLAVAASALLSAVSASALHERHDAFHMKKRTAPMPMGTGMPSLNQTCGCSTYVTTYWGEGTLIQPASTSTPMSVSTSTLMQVGTTYTTVTVAAVTPASSVASAGASSMATSSAAVPSVTVQTVFQTVIPTPGTYTMPATTITIYSSTTVCGASTTMTYAPGTYTAPEQTVTVDVTSYVYYCPFSSMGASTSMVPATTMAAATSTYVAPVATSSAAVSSYVAPSSAATSSYVAPSSSSASAKATSSGTSATIPSGGSQWAMTYTPYNNDHSCKDADSVAVDIAAIAAKGFTSVRLYGTDCSGLDNIGSAARSVGLKLIVGIYISTSGISGCSDQITALLTWAQWDLVEMVIVGNEALYNNYCSASELAAFITSTRSTLTAAGYSGYFTTTETVDMLSENKDVLCSVIDVVTANIHPFFNSNCEASGAGDFVLEQLEYIESMCEGLTGYNVETGWPHAGEANGAAVPGVEEQAIAIASIKEKAGGKCAFFSFEDDLWKDSGDFGVEQSWGCADLFEG